MGTSHHGSHDFWRMMPWEGMSGICGVAAPPPPFLRSCAIWRFCCCICGACICGAWKFGLEICRPPGPSDMFGW
jgi:hypothetical protein